MSRLSITPGAVLLLQHMIETRFRKLAEHDAMAAQYPAMKSGSIVRDKERAQLEELHGLSQWLLEPEPAQARADVDDDEFEDIVTRAEGQQPEEQR